MSDYDNIGEGVFGLMHLFMWAAVISVPLALWKLVDLVVWVCRHVSVSVGG